MGRDISIGTQKFDLIREGGYFLVDKTDFIGSWWRSGDQATLICRPRRFGKTLNMSMLECFFSRRYAGRADLFEGLSVWDDVAMRSEQGKWPVVFLSFAGVKAPSFERSLEQMCAEVSDVYRKHAGSVDLTAMSPRERDVFEGRATLGEGELANSLKRLCELLFRTTGKRAIVLLDEYDAPMQEAWLNGFWDRMAGVVRNFFNNSFKTNDYLGRAVLTGVTRVSRESVFSDLNNLAVVTTTTNQYETSFGFTEGEVFAAMDEMGLADRELVKAWYDGFSFGGVSDIYNPWSVTNYLKQRTVGPYWANTSSHVLVSELVRKGDPDLKSDFEALLQGASVVKKIDEQVAFSDLERNPDAFWALLLASGYLKVAARRVGAEGVSLELALTNFEVRESFGSMVQEWFKGASSRYNGFVRALLAGDVDEMNRYMNDVALETFGVFDVGSKPSASAPERFYHGFVLGLLVELQGRYRVLSNRESGYGRYDVMLVPNDTGRDDGIVIEFKVRDPRREASIEETVARARDQIAEKRFAAELESLGVPAERIREYGFAFEGKQVLIG